MNGVQDAHAPRPKSHIFLAHGAGAGPVAIC